MNSSFSEKSRNPYKDCCWKVICGEPFDEIKIISHLWDLTINAKSHQNDLQINEKSQQQNDEKIYSTTTSDLTGNEISARDENGNVLFEITELEKNPRENISEVLIMRTTPELRTDEDKADDQYYCEKPKQEKNPKKFNKGRRRRKESERHALIEDSDDTDSDSSFDLIDLSD